MTTEPVKPSAEDYEKAIEEIAEDCNRPITKARVRQVRVRAAELAAASESAPAQATDAIDAACTAYEKVYDCVHASEKAMQSALAAAFPALVAEVEQLKAQRQLHAGDTKSLGNELEHMQADRDRLAAENAELQKDAERYRWLRKDGYPLCEAEDSAIDAAINAATRNKP